MIKKCVSLVIIASLCLSMLVGCSSGSNPASDDTGNNPTAAPTTAATSTPSPEPTVAKSEGELLAEQYTGYVETPMDLGGRTIKFVTTMAKRYIHAENKDETPNETLEIIEALESIERDYNCTIEVEQLKGRDMVEALVTAKAAGDVYGDILEFGVSDTYLEEIYAGNLVMPLEDEAIADIIGLDTNPWLSASDFGEMFGHQYGVHFKTNNSGDLLKGVVLFNKDLVEKYNLGNMYDMVNSKEWTFEKLEELSASIASQSDGTVYPLLYNQESIFLPMLIYANGGSVTEYTPEGGYKFTGLQDKTMEALNFAVDLKNKGYIHPKSEVKSENDLAFANGEAVFYVTIYNALKNYTQGTVPMEDSVGLIPGPLGANGDNNYNAVSYSEAMFHVLQNVEKPEEVAAILVAIANRTGKHDMIETELMNTLQDEESADMLQLMYDNNVFDLSRTISTARSTIKGANISIMNLEKTPKAAYEEIESSVQTIFDDIILVD